MPSASARPKRRTSRLQLVYFALAAFDILTISFTLFLSHHTMGAYQASAERSGAWAERSRNVALLGELARQTNAPGNDVFDTHDVTAERAKRDAALVAFRAQWNRVVSEMNQNVDARDRGPILLALEQSRIAMTDMIRESDAIFAQIETRHADAAGRRMATMDRIYGRLTASILQAISDVQEMQAQHQREQLSAAQDLRRYEFVVMGLMLLIVMGVATYGHHIQQVMLRAERDLEDANEALQHYADNVAHELRSPINRMMVGTEVALSRPRSNQDYLDALAANMDECERLSSIVEALLFLANASNFNVDLELQELDVGAELALIGEFFEVSASQAGVMLNVICDPDLAIRADRILFQRAISNLVSNAISHTPQGGSIRIEARARETGVAITVRDTGEGISEAAKAYVFDRFYRERPEANANSTRLGLGLPIAKSIMDMHRGAISLDSETGKGTAITLTFQANALAEHA